MIYYMKGSWTHKDVEDFEDGKESHRFRVVNNAVQVISRSHADVSGWHTHCLQKLKPNSSKRTATPRRRTHDQAET